jgi:DNA modification methylase
MGNLLRNHGGDVYDPFIGSGTTLIAAEQLDRACYAIDLSPSYVDVVVERWQALSGKKATRSRR